MPTARVVGTVADHFKRSTPDVAATYAALILTLKSGKDVRSSRIRKHEQSSAIWWHLEIRVGGPAEVDAELRAWLAAAYQMVR